MMQTRQFTLRVRRIFRVCVALCLTAFGAAAVSAQGQVQAGLPEKPGSLGGENALRTGPNLRLDMPDNLRDAATGIEELIEGRVAGVRIIPDDGAPGAAFSMQIRGLRGFRGDAQPLYILDGVMLNPVRNDAAKTFWEDDHDYQVVQNTLSNINPADIEDITVLKDAASTAIYGSAGANGVVVITTKNSYEGAAVVRWNSSVGVSVIGRTINMLGKQDYLAAMAAADPGFALPFTAGDGVDWQDEATRLAINHSHHVSIGGSTPNLKYYMSAAFTGTEGVLSRSGIRQTTIRVNMDRRVGKTGVIGTRINMGHRLNDMVQSVSPYGSSSMTKSMLTAMPFRTGEEVNDPLADNPQKWYSAYDDRSIEFSVTPMVYFDAGLAPGLRFRTVAGIDYRNKERLRWIGNEVARGKEVNGRAGKSNMHLMGYNLDGYLTYDRTFGDHTVYGRLGASLSGDTYTDRVHEGTFFFNQDLRGKGISLAENVSPYQTIDSDYRMLSFFADAAYTYKGKYTVGGTVRADRTFKYDDGYGDMTYYPAVRGSWNVGRESFMDGQDIVSALVIRAGWGKSGKQALDPYMRASSYITGPDPELDIEDGVTNYYNVRWTSVTEETNIGLEVSFLGDRLSLSADVYKSDTRDNFRYYRHLRKGPYEEVYSNRGKVENKGLELAVWGKPLTGRVKWDAGFTFAYNKNKIIDNGNGGDDLSGGYVGMLAGDPLAMNIARNGSGIGSFYGYHSQGIVTPDHMLFVPPFNGSRPEPGDIKFIDTDKSGDVTAEDMTVIGNPVPRYIIGFQTTVSYKGFSLEAMLEGAFKFNIANLSLLNDYYGTGNYSNLRTKTYRNAYPKGNAPRLNAMGVTEVSSRIIEDGSYLRLARLTLAYDMDVKKVNWIHTLGFTFTAKNLFTITDYSGYSPRVNSYGYDITRLGIDNGAYPSSRTFMLGIRATF